MTRRTGPSRHDLWRDLDRLRETTASPSDTPGGRPITEEWYGEDVQAFVYQVIRDAMTLMHDSGIANLENPERSEAYLGAVRDHYGIDGDVGRDHDVVEALERRANQIDSPHWHPTDAFASALAVFPHRFDADEREAWDRRFETDEDAAAREIVRATYNWLADGRTSGVSV